MVLLALELDRPDGPLGETRGPAVRVRRGSLGRETLAHDLAASRREAAALRRENDRLRAQLKLGEVGTGARGPRDPDPSVFLG